MSSRQSRHHPLRPRWRRRRRSAALGFVLLPASPAAPPPPPRPWSRRDGSLAGLAEASGKVTPIRVPSVVLRSGKKDPVDCVIVVDEENGYER
ncbi:hypothetical protein C4D60_Mb09t23510 [Musa balbisiana]|uniref:Uncharacterized protein n=1 Tax=Musa balbisiana TaxID=52838 RepID=A0A4S8IJA4_MUSBA|nr:hypothetical protein C4D60_Mb09t23510 [Musa balbisiana]